MRRRFRRWSVRHLNANLARAGGRILSNAGPEKSSFPAKSIAEQRCRANCIDKRHEPERAPRSHLMADAALVPSAAFFRDELCVPEKIGTTSGRRNQRTCSDKKDQRKTAASCEAAAHVSSNIRLFAGAVHVLDTLCAADARCGLPFRATHRTGLKAISAVRRAGSGGGRGGRLRSVCGSSRKCTVSDGESGHGEKDFNAAHFVSSH